MNSFKKYFVMFLFAVLFSGCVGIQSTSFTNLSSGGSNSDKVEVTGMGIMNVTVPNMAELEGKALTELRSKGFTKNIVTRLEKRDFMVVQMYNLTVKGER